MPAHESNGHAVAAACPRCGYPNVPTAVSVNNYALNHPPELLARYAGKNVAWSMDGHEVLASADSLANLMDAVRPLDEQGIAFVFDYCPHPDDPGIL